MHWIPARAPRPTDASRRRFLAGATGVIGGLGSALIGACAAPASSTAPPLDIGAWQARLRGDTVALLGEVHDNPEHHRLRAVALRRACEAGWRPVLVMEQFDLDRQADIDRSRRLRPHDVANLVASAAPARSGWEWLFYAPLLEIALEFDLVLRAANLPRAEAGRIVREGTRGVLGERRMADLGLDGIDAALHSAQEREIAAGHCGALPPALLPRMADAQLARDAAMAQVVREAGAGGVVLTAGNGHVRRDIGVPRWLGAALSARALSVGFLETGHEAPSEAYDFIVYAPPAVREDPCRAFAKAKSAG